MNNLRRVVTLHDFIITVKALGQETISLNVFFNVIAIENGREIIFHADFLDLAFEKYVAQILVSHLIMIVPQMLAHLSINLIFHPFFVIDKHNPTIKVTVGWFQTNDILVRVHHGSVI